MQKYVVAAMLMLACLVGASARDVKEAQAALRTELHGTAAPPTVNVQPEVPIRKATQEMRGAHFLRGHIFSSMRTHERLSATSENAATGAVAALCPHIVSVL